MEIKIVYKENSVEKRKHKYIQDFIKFLFENYPLKKNLEIIFLSKRVGNMTTGSRNQKNEIRILAKGRMMRDTLRTLAHEWVHEYQIDVMGRKIGPDIGGINEDEANSIAGKLLKIFEKKHPEKEYMMYE
jgi:hypothetical protein